MNYHSKRILQETRKTKGKPLTGSNLAVTTLASSGVNLKRDIIPEVRRQWEATTKRKLPEQWIAKDSSR